ncbi:NAD(P)-binding protein [Sporormia fimetaria CBS 119925]|uniref:NAD(P)-binding protein n=1 Tax=Sporormia fimetaria CBS 119925 TaxID=1340428 RepID=A0A6A6UY34_9PLEO|nr:NAD(P)-binding protein [Sporormia fimetaria CBS 119925]
MIKVAVAGGSGNVATELLRAPASSGLYDITVFTRKDATNDRPETGVSYRKVDYSSVAHLTEALRGYDVCLSFLVIMSDEAYQAQINLIDACAAAGVNRFAPSEWGINNNSGIRSYTNKDRTAAYLSTYNSQVPRLEYTLFQPSVWMDYFAHPHPLSPNLITWPFFIDFSSRRAIIFSDEASNAQPFVITAVSDVSRLLVRALQDPRPWPPVSGMRGATTSISELLRLAQEIRGGDWVIEKIEKEDIEKGVLKTEWVPQFSHPAVPEEIQEAFSKEFVVEFMRSIIKGAWMVGTEMNERYTDFQWTGLERYLREAWEGRE